MTDREKIIKGLGIVSRMLNEMGRRNEMDIVDDALALLKEQEAVVRCKDCIHIKKLPIDNHGHQPYWCVNLNIYTEGLDWFCADGCKEGR